MTICDVLRPRPAGPCAGKTDGVDCTLAPAVECKRGACISQVCTPIRDPGKDGDSCGRGKGECFNDTCMGGDCDRNNLANGTLCDDMDGEECTIGKCNTPVLAGVPMCVSENAPVTMECNDKDGKICTTGTCNGAGSCNPNRPKGTDCAADDPDKNNPCSEPKCDGKGVCEANNLPDDTACDGKLDTNPCTTELCKSGVCTHQGCSQRLTQACKTPDGKDGTCQTIAGMPPCACVTGPTNTVLFIANLNGFNITSYTDPKMVNGNIAPDTNLAGAQTQLFEPSDIVVTGDSTLIVSSFGVDRITSYAGATDTNGNLTPTRNVEGAATQLFNPVSMAILPMQDLLFVANGGSDSILVYPGVSTSGFNGNLAPVREISSPIGVIMDPTGVNFGTNDDLYIANNAVGNVVVFADPATINGVVDPTRTIESGVFGSPFDVFVDGNDTMYVVDSNGFIFTFNNASTRNGMTEPDFTLTVPGAVNLASIAVDSTGTAYIVDNGADAVYSYDNIGTLNGTLPPDRTIQGSATQLDSPIRVFLVE